MANKSEQIVNEIVDKHSDYETRNASFFADYNEWSDFFTIKKPTKRSNAYSNPRVSEMFRAVNALSTTEYRMLTAQEPNFEFCGYDESISPEQIGRIERTIQTQNKWAGYNKNLLRAIYMKNLFGTVIVEEPFDVVNVNSLGRRIPLTRFEPRSLLQVGFDDSVYDIANAEWITTSDFISKYKIIADAKDDEGAENKRYIQSAVSDAVKDEEGFSGDRFSNSFIASRLAASGYDVTNCNTNVREKLTYCGRLDCLNDGNIYMAQVINRRHLVMFTPHHSQLGKKPFRVATFINWELEPLGLGLGRLMNGLHKSIDNNRQRVHDMIAFNSANMMLKKRSAGISDASLKLRRMGIIDTDETDGLLPVKVNEMAIADGLKLDEILRQEFRTTSGASDTLQAMITEATASEVSLAQNESMRNISVKAEQTAQSLLREHVEYMHENNGLLIKEPFYIINGKTREKIYPADLKIDADVEVKIITDKDYKPQRTRWLAQVYQILTSVRTQDPRAAKVDTLPIIAELLKALNVPFRVQEDVFNNMNQVNNQGAGQTPGIGSQIPEPGGMVPSVGESPDQSIQSTPVGPVMGSQQGGEFA